MDNVSPNSDFPGTDFSHGAEAVTGLDIAWFVLAVLALSAAVVMAVWIVRRVLPVARNPFAILDMRLASGQIDIAEYERAREALLAGQPGAGPHTLSTPPAASPTPQDQRPQPSSSATGLEAGAQAPASTEWQK